MASANKVRLVVGLFDAPQELRSGLMELRDQRVRPDQVSFVAQETVLSGACTLSPGKGDEWGFGTCIVCRPADAPLRWAFVAANGDQDDRIAQDVRSLLGLHDRALLRHAQRLDRTLRAGGALLLVKPDTDAEERLVCMALLQHASGGVQTHELRD